MAKIHRFITNQYDGFGQLITTWTSMDGTSRRLSSEYDADGNRVTLWDNYVSYSNKYGYDGLGRMTNDSEGFGPSAFRLARARHRVPMTGFTEPRQSSCCRIGFGVIAAAVRA